MRDENLFPEKDYVFILGRLIPKLSLSLGLRLNVPDTCCFISGKPKFIVFSRKEQPDNKLGIMHFIR